MRTIPIIGSLLLNPHSFHSSHCVNKIYSVFKPFEIAVCFGKFGFYEIWTPVMRTIPIIASLVLNPHSFHSSHCVNKIYSVFKPFEIAVCFGTFGFYEISTPVMRTMPTMPNIIYINIPNTP